MKKANEKIPGKKRLASLTMKIKLDIINTNNMFNNSYEKKISFNRINNCLPNLL